jgi:hypothetical protein
VSLNPPDGTWKSDMMSEQASRQRSRASVVQLPLHVCCKRVPFPHCTPVELRCLFAWRTAVAVNIADVPYLAYVYK